MLTFDKVCAGYGSRTILNELTLTVKHAEFVHILGENGAGKSTLFSAILGKLPCSSGAIQLNGTLTRSLPSKELARKIAYVSQNTLHGTVGDFTVKENMELAVLRRTPLPLTVQKTRHSSHSTPAKPV